MRHTARIAILLAAAIAPAIAGDAFYLGAWKIVEAKPAPWGDAQRRARSAGEIRSYVGRVVTFEAKRIVGPRLLACAGPRYEVKDYPADMLFQGMLGELRARGGSADPVELAHNLGFRGASWKTLETGCEGAIDFHFIGETTTTFALNDSVYVLKKQR